MLLHAALWTRRNELLLRGVRQRAAVDTRAERGDERGSEREAGGSAARVGQKRRDAFWREAAGDVRHHHEQAVVHGHGDRQLLVANGGKHAENDGDEGDRQPEERNEDGQQAVVQGRQVHDAQVVGDGPSEEGVGCGQQQREVRGLLAVHLAVRSSHGDGVGKVLHNGGLRQGRGPGSIGDMINWGQKHRGV